MTLFTIDVSHHDWDRRGGAFNWAAVKAAGIFAMCAKATEGDPNGYYFADPRFGQHVTGAALQLPVVGAYHVVSKGNQASVNRQVDALRGALGFAESAKSTAFAMIDVEPFPELESRGLTPDWDTVRRFHDRWYELESAPLALYLPKWVWSDTLGSPNISSYRGPLVSSDYGANAAQTPATLYQARGGDNGRGWSGYGGKIPALWQYGSSCQVAGASEETDINAYRGTPNQFIAQFVDQSTEEDTVTTLDNPDRAWLYNASSIIGNLAQGVASAGVRDQAAGKFDETGVLALPLITRILEIHAAVGALTGIATDVAAIRARLEGDLVNEDQLAQALVTAGLTPAAIATAVIMGLGSDVGAQVAHELARRLMLDPPAA